MDKSVVSEFQHKEHTEWLKLLQFYKEEIGIFQGELSLVLNSHSDRLSLIEHVDEYRTIFYKKLGQIEAIRNQINSHEKELSIDLDPETEDLWDHQEVRRQMADFTTEMESMKKNFRRFVAKNMK